MPIIMIRHRQTLSPEIETTQNALNTPPSLNTAQLQNKQRLNLAVDFK